MQKFTFTIKGIGLEQGYVCINCVKSIIQTLSSESAIDSVTFSNIQKEFILLAGIDNVKKVKSIITKAAKRAGEPFNKTFVPDNIKAV